IGWSTATRPTFLPSCSDSSTDPVASTASTLPSPPSKARCPAHSAAARISLTWLIRPPVKRSSAALSAAGGFLGQAAQLVYSLPSKAVTDVTAYSSPTNVRGAIVTGTTNYVESPAALVAPLQNTKKFYSAMYNSPFSTRWFVLGFGLDSSLTTGRGWDNVTGVGTPNGLAFVNAVAAASH